MRRTSAVVLGVALLIGLSLAAPSGTVADTVFGPKSFVRTTGSPNVFTESFVVCKANRDFLIRVENGPDGAVKIASGTLTINDAEVVHTLDFGQQITLIERPVRLQPSNTLTVRLAGTPQGTARIRILSPVGCGPEIAITSPAAGATVPAGMLLVRGTVTASGEVGVSVNGFPALISGNQWAVEIPVDLSTELLSATATVVGGDSTSVTVPITMSASPGQLVRFQGEPADGVTPFTVTWKISNDTGRQLVQYELDPTGYTGFGSLALTPDETQTTYSTPGLWYPMLRATDDQGVTYTTMTVVLANDPRAVTARFRALWGGLKSRLQDGDVSGALAFLAPALRSRLEPVFQQLGSDLPAVVAGLGLLHVTDQAGDLAEAVVTQDESGGPALYFIQFRRDGLGRWLIEEM
jgi:hypothetical protein